LALRFLKESEELLNDRPYKLEKCHLELYRWLFTNGKEEELQNLKNQYLKLGSKILPTTPKLPFNLP
jgi:hypothetical protein